ncbi:hypothetical protein [Reyranella sp.]|uniref:hypothetical protein n=1 Tax=Reyranella sp. TaxID=1929291 RepID=UPI002730A96C|nr:hypothetical protein [Reyranella sp.]MDP2376290.1 hypothetical protein [Reyranella sp.]
MPLATPLTTFGDLAADGLAEVACANCGHRRTIDGNAPRLARRRVAGARFRCEQCGSVGLPSIAKQRLWQRRAAEHGRKLKTGGFDHR